MFDNKYLVSREAKLQNELDNRMNKIHQSEHQFDQEMSKLSTDCDDLLKEIEQLP